MKKFTDILSGKENEGAIQSSNKQDFIRGLVENTLTIKDGEIAGKDTLISVLNKILEMNDSKTTIKVLESIKLNAYKGNFNFKAVDEAIEIETKKLDRLYEDYTAGEEGPGEEEYKSYDLVLVKKLMEKLEMKYSDEKYVEVKPEKQEGDDIDAVRMSLSTDVKVEPSSKKDTAVVSIVVDLEDGKITGIGTLKEDDSVDPQTAVTDIDAYQLNRLLVLVEKTLHSVIEKLQEEYKEKHPNEELVEESVDTEKGNASVMLSVKVSDNNDYVQVRSYVVTDSNYEEGNPDIASEDDEPFKSLWKDAKKLQEDSSLLFDAIVRERANMNELKDFLKNDFDVKSEVSFPGATEYVITMDSDEKIKAFLSKLEDFLKEHSAIQEVDTIVPEDVKETLELSNMIGQVILEHHLEEKEDKIEFIMKNIALVEDDVPGEDKLQALQNMSDSEIDELYKKIEDQGVKE